MAGEHIMKYALVVALLSCTGLVLPASAQQQPTVTPDAVPAGQADAKATIVRCGQLVALITASQQPPQGVTVDQARRWAEANDGASCSSAADRLIQAAPGR